ncbi:RNaseH domain-containing protein [Nonomuraea longicatena]|uniref:DUF3893 domain-containing protein n=1 Tax=Nonomuraea longicatena TaxID=83682 RepID=A0ABN1R373_9ACTN
MMITNAFRIPTGLLGEVWAYPMTTALTAAFDQLSEVWRRKSNNEHARAPYQSLATALSAVTGQPVMILRGPRTYQDPPWLITTAQIPPALLRRATRVWERLARGNIDANVIGPLISEITPERLHVADEVDTTVPGRVTASNWVYRVLRWNLARALAETPVRFDSREVEFRLDSNGDMVAWDDPITLPLRKGGLATGIIKISLSVKTLPGIGDLVCMPTISLARLVSAWPRVKSAWIDHGRPTLLRVPVGTIRTETGFVSLCRDYSAQVVEECGLEPLPWGEDVLVARPERVRAWRSVNGSHPLGTGVGARTYLRFAEHADKLAGVEPVTYQLTRTKVLKNAADAPIGSASLDTAVRAAGLDRLRIVHLSAHSATRDRVRLALDGYRQEPLSSELGTIHPLTTTSDFVAFDLPETLAHGVADRSRLLDQAPLLKPEPGTLVVALVDTSYEGQKVTDDAKGPLRRELAKLSVPSQFIAIPPGSDGSRAKPKKENDPDFPVVTAIKDLLRAAGMTDDRLAAAVDLRPHPLDRDMWLVGVHVRIQNSKNGNGSRPYLVHTMVALHAKQDRQAPWDLRMYVPGQGWLQHVAGLTAFHAGPIGAAIGNQQQAFAGLRGLVDNALSELPGDDPIVVMADADETRRVWSGLCDGKLWRGLLPGDGLARAEEITVVRVGTSDEAVPRPVTFTDGKQSADPDKPASPRNRIYELAGDDGSRSWLLGHASRLFNQGSKGRVGADFTRFTLPAKRVDEQGNNWHAFTCTEFVVVRPGLINEDHAVAMASRLCAQPLSWDAQTRWPVPLHLANIADEDHPNFRTGNGDEDLL